MENLKPLRQSNFSTAWIRPRLPSWTRSSRGSSAAWYFLAMDTTRRRLALTNVSAASSPSRIRRRSSRLRAGVIPSARGELGPGLAAGLDGLGQAGLVVLGEQGMLADVVQVEADQVLLGLSGVLVGHSSSSLDVPGQILLAKCRRSGVKDRQRRTSGISEYLLINPKS